MGVWTEEVGQVDVRERDRVEKVRGRYTSKERIVKDRRGDRREKEKQET